MWLIPSKNGMSADRVAQLLRNAVAESRFTAEIEVSRVGKQPAVEIRMVRLRRKKGYCGAHPGPCLALFRKHRVGAWLEGADWVGFFHGVNNALDAAAVDCRLFSHNRETRDVGRYYLRRGRERRVHYPYGYSGNFAHWTQEKADFETCFADHCGKPPPEYPYALTADGTPGYMAFTVAEEDACRAEEVA